MRLIPGQDSVGTIMTSCSSAINSTSVGCKASVNSVGYILGGLWRASARRTPAQPEPNSRSTTKLDSLVVRAEQRQLFVCMTIAGNVDMKKSAESNGEGDVRPNRWLGIISSPKCSDEDKLKVLESCISTASAMLRRNDAVVDLRAWKHCMVVMDRCCAVSKDSAVCLYDNWLTTTVGMLVPNLHSPKLVGYLFGQSLHRTWWTGAKDLDTALSTLRVSDWLQSGRNHVVLKVLVDLFTVHPLLCHSSAPISHLISYTQHHLCSSDPNVAQQAGLLLPKLWQMAEALQPKWNQLLSQDEISLSDLHLIYGIASSGLVDVSNDQAKHLCTFALPHQSQQSQGIVLDTLHTLLELDKLPTRLTPLLFEIMATQSITESSLLWKQARLLQDYLVQSNCAEQEEALSELLRRSSSGRHWIWLLQTAAEFTSTDVLMPRANDIWQCLTPRLSSNTTSRKAVHALKTLVDRLPLQLDQLIVREWIPLTQRMMESNSSDSNIVDLIIHLHCALPANVALEAISAHDTEIFLRINERIKKGSVSMLVPTVSRSMVGIGTFELLHDWPATEALDWMTRVILANCKTQTPEIRVKILADVKRLIQRLKVGSRVQVLRGLLEYSVHQLWEGASSLRHFFHVMLLQLLVELSAGLSIDWQSDDLWLGLKVCMSSSYTNVRFATKDLMRMLQTAKLSSPSVALTHKWQAEAFENLPLQSLTKTESAGILGTACPPGFAEQVWKALLNRLEMWKNVGISEALTSLPVHGHLFALSLLLPTETPSPRDLMDTAVHCIRSALPFVANDAPEGYVDQEWEDEVDMAQKSQILLHSAYLTIKHACGIICQLPSSQYGLEMMDWTLQVKHKGVIKPMCDATVSLLKPGPFPLCDLTEAMDETTVYRRSAGLAALIVSLLKAFPSELHVTIDKLVSLTTAPSLNHRVHALNCLRAFFKDSKLSQQLVTSQQLTPVCQAAIDAFKAIDFAENNAGLMLFVALTDRLGKFNWTGFVRQCPELTRSLLAALESSVDGGDAKGLSILVLLKHLLDNQTEMRGDSELLTSILFKACGATIYQIRQLAAVCLGRVLAGQDLGPCLLDMALNVTGCLQHGLLGACLSLAASEHVVDMSHLQRMWTLFESSRGWTIKTRLLELFLVCELPERDVGRIKQIAADLSQPSLVRQRALQLLTNDAQFVLEFAVKDPDAQVRQRALQLLADSNSNWSETAAMSLVGRFKHETHPQCVPVLFQIAGSPNFPLRSQVVPIAEGILKSREKNHAVIAACIPIAPHVIDDKLAKHNDPAIRKVTVSHALLDNVQVWEQLLQDPLEELRIRASRRLHPVGIPPTPEVALEMLIQDTIAKLSQHEVCEFIQRHTLVAKKETDALFAVDDQSEVSEPLQVYKYIKSSLLNDNNNGS